MKKNYILLTFTLLMSIVGFSQTTYLTTALVGGNSAAGTTFNITANQSVFIKDIRATFLGAGTGVIWYTPSAINGPPTITAANGWIQIASGPVINVGIGNTMSVAPTNLLIPAGSTFGFFVGGVLMSYTGSTTIPATPNSWTDGIITINSGLLTGYGGPAPNPVNHPRTFNGSIGYEVATRSMNDGGVSEISPSVFCAGTDSVKVTIKNFGYNLINSLQVNWQINGVLQTPVNYSASVLDTFGGIGSQTASVFLGLQNFIPNTTYNIEAWTSLPNGVADTVSRNDSTIVSLRPGLNGIYTVNAGAPASGTNYQNFATLFDDLQNSGICGPVTFNVAPGTGPYIMSEDISTIVGNNSVNTITFNGNGNTINHGGGNFFLAMDNIKHCTIRNFNFVNETPTVAKFGIMMRGKCSNIVIKNNTLDLGIDYTSAVSGAIVSSSNITTATGLGDNADSVTIDSNIIIGSYYGVRLNGLSTTVYSQGNRITNNTISDFYLYGVFLQNQNNSVTHNNDITRGTRSTLSTFYGVYGTQITAAVISNNKIHSGGNGSYTSYPLYFTNSTNALGNETYIVNNAIYDMGVMGTGTYYGIYLLGTMSHLKVWHNTISQNTDGSTGVQRGIFRSTAPNNEEYRNNLIEITGSGTGAKHCFHVATTSTTFTGGNNLLYMGATAGTNNLAFFGTVQTTIAAWSTASNTTGNSIANPSIASGTFTPLASGADNGGVPIPFVTTDITGAPRSATTPDFGALEFIGLPGDISLTDAKLVQENNCYGMADTAFATIKNEFGSLIDFSINPITVNWTTTGPVNDAGSTTINSGTLAVGASLTVSINTIDMSIPGTYSVSAYIDANAVNAAQINDTLTNHKTFDKKSIILVNPLSDTIVATANDSIKISSQSPFYPGGAFLFTEVCQFKTTVGAPASGWPAYLTSDDYLEITGVPNSDLAGYSLEQWSTTARTSNFTFLPGTLLSPNGTAIIMIGEGGKASEPANFLYDGRGGSTFTYGSSTAAGRILKDASGNIIDAHGYSGYNFPVSAGVSAADWSAPLAGGVSTSGHRLTGADLNTGANWVVSSAANTQNPNSVNAGVTVPAPVNLSGVQWTNITSNTALDTTAEIYAKGWTGNGLYQYQVSFNTPCGVFSDTSSIFVLIQTLDTVAPITVCDTFRTPNGNMTTVSAIMSDTVRGTIIPYDSLITFYPVTINNRSTSSFSVAICDSLVAPSGKALYTTGTYLDTIPNAIGCDSIITINLTITTTTFVRDTVFACDSNNFRGRILTMPGTYFDTLFTGSCDSIFIRRLTMGYASFATFTQFVCDSFVSPTGKVWKTNGVYRDTIINASGCDSNMTFNLTFGYISYATRTVTRCDRFVSPSGRTWTTSGTYRDTITNRSGCDSAMTFIVTINNSFTRTDNIRLCAGIPHRVGPNLYRVAGTYTDVFTTFLGCDSTIVTNLFYYAPAVRTINYNFCMGDSIQVLGNWYYAATTFMDTIVGGSSNGCDSVTTHVITTRTTNPELNLGNDVVSCLDGGVTIFASNAYDTYNWSNGGTTNVLSVNGSTSGIGSTDYILTVTQASSGCTARDTVNISFRNCTGINENEADLNVNLYPNPASNFVTIEVFDKYNTGNMKLEIMNSLGQVVSSQTINSTNEKIIMDVNNFNKGIYFVRISSDKLYMTKKLLIQK